MDPEDGVIVLRRAEIDTRAPFRSVKEAVTLFGEKVLGGEIYGKKLKEVNMEATKEGEGPSKLGSVTAELEETKQSLEKARAQSCTMANSLSSLKQELDKTKRELQQFKEREMRKQVMESENEDVRIVEDSQEFEVKMSMSKQEAQATEFQKKRYVTFANPPSQARHVTIPQGVQTLERLPSLTKKKKPLIPLIGGIFSRKKRTQQAATP